MKIFLINLDTRTDRLKTSSFELGKLGHDFSRIAAIDAKKVFGEDDLVTRGVKACWQSHKKCFELLIESDDDFAFICEDDIEIRDADKINTVLKQAISLNLDLLQVGFLTQGILNKLLNVFFIVESFLFRTLNTMSFLIPTHVKLSSRLRVRIYSDAPRNFLPDLFFPGTHAYLISKKMAREVLHLNSPQFLSADDFFTALSRMRTFRIYRLKFSLASQSNSSPSISSRFQRID